MNIRTGNLDCKINNTDMKNCWQETSFIDQLTQEKHMKDGFGWRWEARLKPLNIKQNFK